MTDYAKASQLAREQKKDLLIYFRDGEQLDAVFADPNLRDRLAKFVLLRVPADYEVQGKRLLSYPALAEMMGRPGLAIVSLHNKELPTFNTAISVHPWVSSRYGWVPGYGVSEVAAVTSRAHAETWLPAGLFVLVSAPSRPSIFEFSLHYRE